MDECIPCGAKLIDGASRCPDCGAKLSKRGVGLFMAGCVAAVSSSIPLVIGSISARQGLYLPLAIGVLALFAGIALIVAGKVKMARSPATTRPGPPSETFSAGSLKR